MLILDWRGKRSKMGKDMITLYVNDFFPRQGNSRSYRILRYIIYKTQNKQNCLKKHFTRKFLHEKMCTAIEKN